MPGTKPNKKHSISFHNILRISIIALCILIITAPSDSLARKNDDDRMELLRAMKEKNHKKAKSLLKSDVDADAEGPFEGESLLMFAAVLDDNKMVKILLDAGADPNGRTDSGFTVLMKAAGMSSKKVVKTLLKAGADVNATAGSNVSALYFAARYQENEDVIETLLDAGADINACLDDGTTVLMGAAENPNIEITKVLLEAGANLSIKDNGGKTAIQKALAVENIEYAKVLFKAGANPNTLFDEKMTLLMLASATDRIEFVKLLLDENAELDSKSENGTTALMMACSYNPTFDVAELLIKSGADIDLKNDQDLSAIATATIKSKPDLVRFLINNGADVETETDLGLRPLMFAAAYCDLETAKVLVEGGADLDAINLLGNTALETCKEGCTDVEIRKLLGGKGNYVKAKIEITTIEPQPAPKHEGPFAIIPPASMKLPVTFTMGEKGKPEETPHQVTLTGRFEMATEEVTNAQYISVLQWAFDNRHISVFGQMVDGNLDNCNQSFGTLGDQFTYTEGIFSTPEPEAYARVTWYQAIIYCDLLNLMNGQPLTYSYINGVDKNINSYKATGYRLPTEAEWEFACRAGTTTSFNTQNYKSKSSQSLSAPDEIDATSFSANAWGLRNMHGYVGEWCYDWYGPYAGDKTNPKGRKFAHNRVVRGFELNSIPGSASRHSEEQFRGANLQGIRPVRTLK